MIEILELSDGIMVARDLGVEVPVEEVPIYLNDDKKMWHLAGKYQLVLKC